jgi:hypothetical protein
MRFTVPRAAAAPGYAASLVDKASFGRLGVKWVLPLLASLGCGCAGKAARDPVKGEATGEAGAAGAPALVDNSGGIGGGVSVAPFASCQQHVDCVVTYLGCCASCGEQSIANMVAINREDVTGYHAASCGFEPPVCSSCSSFYDPYLVARCVDGQCTALDLFQAPFNECTVSDDCHLRTNTCCPCQAGVSLISASLAQEPELRALLCDADATCDDCSSLSVTDVDAGCREGRCVLLFPF